ncbi:MAG: DUF501 domain-containing protein [Acidimicrobiales bacterium]
MTVNDVDRVAELLGHPPRGAFKVVVRTAGGDPVVIRNAAFLDDGEPMPTRWWLVGAVEAVAVGRLESSGGVRQAEAEVDPAEVEAAHRRYQQERDATVEPGHEGPRPSGGVGGTRTGVKCLHAHAAWYLAGGDDPIGAWVAAKLGWRREDYVGDIPGPVAAIDCGTNSTRLLVAAPDGTPLERVMHITRLGHGVDATGRLAPEAIDRTVAVLVGFKEIMDQFGVTRARMTATSAARDSANRSEFLAAAAAAVGVEAEMLSGADEGRLSYAGATAELPSELGPYLVVDIGGGSTELFTATGPHPGKVVGLSMDVGCVRLSERFLISDPPTLVQLVETRAFVAEWVDRARHEVPELAGARVMVGLAGTVSALALVSQQLRRYSRERIHHHVLARSEVDRLWVELASQKLTARRKHMGPEAARADVIVGGVTILSEVMEAFGHEQCLVSEADILDGLIMSQLAAT